MGNPIKKDGELHQMMKSWRQAIHNYPETAFEETKTAEKIANLLRSFKNIEVHTGLAKTGVVGILTGISGKGKMIGLRADIDALDIEEETGLEYASNVKGKMHACGHDGHTAMLLGAAKYLSENPDFSGQVAFIFQPAEENAGGGEVMVKEGLFEKFPCDSVYGMHIWPGLKIGEFAVHEKEVMASTDSFDVVIQGSGAHAAMPNLGIDPIMIGSQLIGAFQTIVSRTVAPTDTAVISVTMLNAGSAFNIIPDSVTLHGTVRTFCGDVRDTIHTSMQQQVTHLCEAFGANGTLNFHDTYPATINYPPQARECAQVVTDMVGKKNVYLDMPPSMGAEDFSYMLMEKPGAYIWVGNGENSYGLHHPKFNFNDDVLPIGASYWVNLTNHLLE